MAIGEVLFAVAGPLAISLMKPVRRTTSVMTSVATSIVTVTKSL